MSDYDYDPDHIHLYEQSTKQWLCTTASQIFFMQLGFLCYEVGFVKPVWTQCVIIKNIEDTFVGVLTFLTFGYTLSESDSFYGIIGIPTNPLLIGVDSESHDKILISAFFASTCATIISGAVLERMKNKAYIVWCLLIILINYSFISHWVWHEHGWLNKLGFVDGAGSVVVHSTAGMSALIAVWHLGPRKGSLDRNGELLPIGKAARPIINAIGALFLWYGWFAFNVASPIAFSRGIDVNAIGTTALVTVISPISSVCSGFVWMWLGFVPLSFENLLSCLLAGLVSITGMCHTCGPIEAVFVGCCASVVYFVMSRIIRNKFKLDDPLNVIAIHLCCGMFSGITEGIVANDTYGTPGLIHGGLRHFGIQLLGVLVIVTFNVIAALCLWQIVLKKVIFRRTEIRVSILDIYLGTRLFDQNYDMALHEVLSCDTNAAKAMLFGFHQYMSDRYAPEQLDFLVVVGLFNKYLACGDINLDAIGRAQYILQIVNTYVDQNGTQCINISGTQRSILLKIRKHLLFELKANTESDDNQMRQRTDTDLIESDSTADFYYSAIDLSDITKENVFHAVFESVWKIVVPHFTMYLRKHYQENTKIKFNIVKIPFSLNPDWSIKWDKYVTKDKKNVRLVDIVPGLAECGMDIKVQTLTKVQLSVFEKNNKTQIGGKIVVVIE